jgi:hypothetical protein
MTKTFTHIDADELNSVTGAGTRGAGGTDTQLQTMLSSITDSIKEVANSKNTNSSDQMMPMMMMMMMMGGGGGGSAAAAAAPPPPPPPATVVKVNVRR